MGLDIVAWEKATPIEVHPDECDDCYDGHHVEAYALRGMERSLRGLEPGWYEVSGWSSSFSAGSYSGYNEFRENLCRAALGVKPETVWADPAAYADRPFYELVNFADNEGTIGPEAAADLAADFTEQAATVRGKLDSIDQDRYDEWANAFALAAGSGVVVFS